MDPHASARWHAAALALVLLAACGGGDDPPSVRPFPTPTPTPSPSPTAVDPTPTDEPSPSPSPSPAATPPSDPAPRLGPGAPTAYRRRVPIQQVETGELIPVDARLTRAIRLDGGDGRIVVTWSRGEGPFRSEHGLSIWELRDDRPPWRAVAGFHAPLQQEVLGIRLQAGDLTGDGHQDVLSFEETGGSGACGRWRVFGTTPDGVREILRRRTCDTDILLADGRLMVQTAVFEPGDAHCCPSALRRTTLRWDGERWERLRVRLIPLT